MQLIAQNLTGRFVRLEPLLEAHREGLRAAASDPAIWTYMPDDGNGPGFDSWFDAGRKIHESGAHIAFAVRRLTDNILVGSTRFFEIVPAHKRAEIGWTWYAKSAQASAVNPECKLLLLAYAFAAGANRIELKTDARNARSRAAIMKLGAKEEGIFRAHMVVRDGYIRDTVYFSIIRSEWPEVRAGLEARLAAEKI
ncbi:MAG: GNAT family N-acetyltransferase [Pseudomonadota bacterium]